MKKERAIRIGYGRGDTEVPHINQFYIIPSIIFEYGDVKGKKTPNGIFCGKYKSIGITWMFWFVAVHYLEYTY